MCYDDEARPPTPPGQAAPAHGEDLVLTADDGNRFAAYRATPQAAPPASGSPAAAHVLIYPDVRGLHQFYKELALRFAEVGIPALALDYFGRTAGLTSRDEGFEFMPHAMQIRRTTFGLDVRAALAAIRATAGQDANIFVVGFCMGGGLALATGTNPEFGFAGLIPFYAGLSRDSGEGTVLSIADKVGYPVLGLFGGADQGIPASDVEALDQQLAKAGVEHTLITYPGAPHSFFDRRAAEYADASADAWRRSLDFIAAHR